MAEAFEEGEVEEEGGGDADAPFFLEQGRGGGGGGGEADLGEGAVGCEAGEVAVVAEVVEGFVGVFDGDFGASGGGEEGACYSLVEVCAVGVALVGREDQELGYAGAGGEGGEGEGGFGGEGKVLGLWGW